MSSKKGTSASWSRRKFLKAGALGAGAAGLILPDVVSAGTATNQEVNCILLFLVGGPSHLDTFDMKPNAPENVRGPFRPAPTSVPGMQISEHLPRTASLAKYFSIVRSVHHTAAPIHETGHQLMQTGSLFTEGRESPHFGSALSYLRGPRDRDVPPFVVVPGPIRSTGVSVSHGQTAGPLGERFGPMFYDVAVENSASPRSGSETDCMVQEDRERPVEARRFESLTSMTTRRAFDLRRESEATRSRYGLHTFGQSTLLARRLVEHGVRFVTVNMFDTVFDRLTWDCHADGATLATTLDDYATTLCPMFDQTYSALLEDLHQRGMLSNTLVLAFGEFGRTPVINARGGRDHWTGAWSVLFAGGGLRGGQVIGATDAWGGEIKDRPVQPANIAATVYRSLGIDPNVIPTTTGRVMACAAAEPIIELF